LPPPLLLPLPLLLDEEPPELPLEPLLPPELELLELAEPLPLEEPPPPPHSDSGTQAFTWAPLAVARIVHDSDDPHPVSPPHFAAQYVSPPNWAQTAPWQSASVRQGTHVASPPPSPVSPPLLPCP
jgi:hypothetical protein